VTVKEALIRYVRYLCRSLISYYQGGPVCVRLLRQCSGPRAKVLLAVSIGLLLQRRLILPTLSLVLDADRRWRQPHVDHGSPMIQQACSCTFVEAAEPSTYHSEYTSAWTCSKTFGLALGLNKLPYCPIQLLSLQRLLNGIEPVAQPSHSLIDC